MTTVSEVLASLYRNRVIAGLAPGWSSRHASAPTVVMPGLDPGIHSVTVELGSQGDGMDCRVKPGNDDSV
jgi:hypothetical protein